MRSTRAAQFMPGGTSNPYRSRALVERSSRAFCDLSDEDIEALVQSLNSLHEGDLGVDMLVACGKKAITPLQRFLLQGKPSGIFAPRQRAVRALAELGAKDVLLDYLAWEGHIVDPVAAHGEEAVKNTAARALGAWRTEDVFEALRHVSQRKHLVGVIETLGEFRRPEAVPELIEALEDDFCRTFAEDALRKAGELAHSALIDAARTPDPSGSHERPQSQRRRRCALRLLECLQLCNEDWCQVTALLHDSDPEIAARAGAIALAVADRGDKELAVKRMIEALPTSDWLLQGEIQGWFERHLDAALPSINEEIDRREAPPASIQTRDHVLRLLLTVRRKGQDEGDRERNQ
jgi:HEAT repeat protein